MQRISNNVPPNLVRTRDLIFLFNPNALPPPPPPIVGESGGGADVEATSAAALSVAQNTKLCYVKPSRIVNTYPIIVAESYADGDARFVSLRKIQKRERAA